ncbi:arsenate reductase ArsC [Opitutus sp. GAS368]|jgi:arsenate reductase|uniref:arsenate reductase ArsC n=1 Tax=Opitutus sp. GAS368 TaxID=1882749 RepID=UPI000879A688|nr:arsenate reductase ArsC [Opitutus sp. GAS368]SDR85973.1 Protein-tyrosine-phosphatase [Opitutus sp. GAS368]
MTTKTPYKVLILCTGNSARSILGEYLLRAKGQGRFEVHSAGSHPTGRVNPLAVRTLREKYGIEAGGARSKSWDEFKAVRFDFVITVCDNAKEACPIWPGQPMIAHWGSPDPAAVEGTEEEKFQFFVNVASQIARRVDLFCAFPDDRLLDAVAVRDVGRQFKLEGEAGLKR